MSTMVASQRGQTLTRRIPRLKFRPATTREECALAEWMLKSIARRKGVQIVRKVTWITVPSCTVATHSDHKRRVKLMMQDPIGAHRVVRTKTRHEEAIAITMIRARERKKRLQDGVTTHQNRVTMNHHHQHHLGGGNRQWLSMQARNGQRWHRIGRCGAQRWMTF